MPDAPLLTRRKVSEKPESWHIYYEGDVLAGVISQRSGAPKSEPQWNYFVGFYPGSNPGDQIVGTAETFEEACAEFEKGWAIFLAKRTPEDFEEYRQWQRDQVGRYDRR